MRTSSRLGAVCLALAALAFPLALAQASAAMATGQVAAASGPLCPDQMQPEWVFVRTVWAYPPYDVYRVKQSDGTDMYVNVICR